MYIWKLTLKYKLGYLSCCCKNVATSVVKILDFIFDYICENRSRLCYNTLKENYEKLYGFKIFLVQQRD
jgi:hypothetical protein